MRRSVTRYHRSLDQFTRASRQLAIDAGKMAAEVDSDTAGTATPLHLGQLFDQWFADHDALMARLQDDLFEVLSHV